MPQILFFCLFLYSEETAVTEIETMVASLSNFAVLNSMQSPPWPFFVTYDLIDIVPVFQSYTDKCKILHLFYKNEIKKAD